MLSNRQYLACRVDGGQAVTSLQPAGDGTAQRIRPLSGRISRESVEVVRQCLTDEARRRMLGLTNRKPDWLEVGGWRNTLEQFAQFFEGVGVQTGEVRIHFGTLFIRF